ncbi:MAG: FAD-dependent monooxygenase [Bdellovibrio sp.]|nr:FAD-dependent monooxygenase [Methylotenera sp.]
MTHHFFQSEDESINTDIAIVGSGLVGLSAAIAFAQQGKRVALIDAKNSLITLKNAWDARVYALTPETENWLTSIGVWAHVDVSRVNPINTMHIFDEASEQPLSLRDEDANLPKLGVIIENQNLMHALWQQLKTLAAENESVVMITDAACKTLHNTQNNIALGLANNHPVNADLMVAADGVDSWVRTQANIGVIKKDFHQTAVVGNFLVEKPHQNIARQWFRPHDVLALLPLPENMVSIVWSVSTERAAELLALSSEDLAHLVHEHSRGILGKLKPVGTTQAFALNQQTATQLIAERTVLMGDAAHQIHPMAGQGVNLGFRDVMQLALLATKFHAMQNMGDKAFLRQYERARKADILTMNQLTSGLDALFATDSRMAKKVTGKIISKGLQVLNSQTYLKKLLIQQVAA